MSRDFIQDLLDAVNRVVPPDAARLRELLIVCGMPEKTQNLRYLCFNRHTVTEKDRILEFSAVAVINNRRTAYWRLEGIRARLSGLVFHPLWTFNPLDLFLIRLRCDQAMMDLLSGAAANYTLLGIVRVEETSGANRWMGRRRYVRPVIALPGLREEHLEAVEKFEARLRLRSSRR